MQIKELKKMRCQMPGCKNKAIKLSKRNILNCGIYLENKTIWHCGNHSENDLEKIYDFFAEDTQIINPIIDVKKIEKSEN